VTSVYLLLATTLFLVVFALVKLRKLHWSVHEAAKSQAVTLRAIDTIYSQISQQQNAFRNAPHPVLLHTSDYDRESAPDSGIHRQTWINVGEKLLENVLLYSDGMTEALRFPHSTAAGYPRFNTDGTIFGLQYSYLEGYARSLFLATSMLSVKPDLRISDRSVGEYYLDFLLRGCDRYDSASFGWENNDRPTQTLVEAASICICLREGRDSLWNQLSVREQRKIVGWLDHYKDTPPHWNNWVWFTILINTFLKTEGHPFNRALIEKCKERVKGLYVDSGWYKDGEVFDYYSAWSMQFNPIFWISWDGESDIGLKDELERHNDLFLNSYAHLFSRQGSMPVWGRSVCYRYAATSPFSVAYKRPSLPSFDPGFARYLCSANLRQFMEHPEFLKGGIPSLGFYGEKPNLIDAYSCTASTLLSCQSFLALTLPADNAFWKAPESIGFWLDPPSRYDIGTTGLWVAHESASGHSRLHTEQQIYGTKHAGDPRYAEAVFSTEDVVYETR